MAAVDITAFEQQLGTVVKRVFDGIRVEVLVDAVAAVSACAGGHGLHGPGVFHPAAFVDVVDEEVAIAAAAGPQEPVELPDLVEQLADVAGLGRHERRANRARLAIGSQRDDIANLSPLDPVEKLLPRLAVPAHQPDANLEVFLDRLLAQGQHPARGGTVNGDGLLHEDMESLLDGVGEVDPAKRRWRGEDHNIARLQAIHGLTIRVEANEFLVVVNAELFATTKVLVERLVAGVELVV